MRDKSWSFVLHPTLPMPSLEGQPHYEPDRRTIVANVRLKPGTSNAVWLNSPQHLNFVGQDGRPAEPYLFTFQTRK